MEALDHTTAVVRSVQSTDTRCGAACCVMALSHYGLQVSEDQADGEISLGMQESNEWYADPAGVAYCLNVARNPDAIDFDVYSHAFDSIGEAYGKIAHTIIVRKMPCLALIYAGAHWVIIEGIRVDAGSAEYSIIGFTVVDPYASEPARRFIPAKVFERRYFQPIDYGQKWHGKFVVVGDSEANPLARSASVRSRRIALALMSMILPLTRFSPYAAALDSLAAHEFKGIRKFLAGAAPFQPRQVRELSLSSSDYTILFVDGRNNPYFRGAACLAIDDDNGELLEATSDFAKYLASEKLAIEAANTKFGVGMYQIDDAFYWAASPLSRSRFSILRQVSSDSKIYFIFPDGTILASLPVFSKGGA